MSQKTRSTFVLLEPNEILQAMVGLKDVAVVAYERHGPNVDFMGRARARGRRLPDMR